MADGPAAKAVPEPSSHARRDELLAMQIKAQKKWEDHKAFEVDAPAEGQGTPAEKFYGTFPYPYMNGLLHLGHAFSLSKLVFASGYHKLVGKRVLFPQGFHCTGMPIKACADKLKHEIARAASLDDFVATVEEYARTGILQGEDAKSPEAEEVKEEVAAAQGPATKFASKKSKAAAKTGGAKYQWQIMLDLDIPPSEIERFRDERHWLRYFPPKGMRDIQAMGAGVDARRTFITTDENPFYDAFIRWQFEVLRRQGRVIKAVRLSVYSPLDGQPCADHDRASGEGAKPQEYTLIKMRALALPPALAALEVRHVTPLQAGMLLGTIEQAAAAALSPLELLQLLLASKGKGSVYLMAATLRPETMYGQTNCWVLPDGEYGAYAGPDGDVYVMAPRSARNLLWQFGLPAGGAEAADGQQPMEEGAPKLDKDSAPQLLALVKGKELLGTPLQAPNCPFERIYVLPLTSISMSKGTGVVTSVPSDSPDDWRALEDLRAPKMAEKYGLDLESQILPFEVVPIIDIPGLGNRAAETVCKQLGIKSQHDAKKLEEAKKQVYLKGFTEGVLTVGPHAGKKVSEIKGIIRQELLAAGQAVAYAEPEKQVISRSGDECVVALTDQWYMTYGEAEWQASAQQVLRSMKLYGAEKDFEAALEWLNQWACSRSFGLGTRLPWDEQYLIESLSDSTIYMAFYTVAHILQQGDMYGDTRDGPVQPQHLTNEVWEHVFLDGPQPTDTPIPADVLAKMRREFEYWYPLDLRVSGKDLIQNHLSFCLYTHASVWAGHEDRQPRAFRTNGHLMLNSEKMSKSTGNFKTLQQAIQEYSADAMRIALADAGDTMDDANFDEKVANAAVLRLTKEAAWVAEAVKAIQEGELRNGEDTFIDRAFDNEISAAVAATQAAYENLEFREALKAGWFELQNMRDWYRVACGPAGMKRSHIQRFIEVQTRLLAPIAPHWAEHVWGDLLKKEGLVITAGWPQQPAQGVDGVLQLQRSYLEEQIARARKEVAGAQAVPKKKKADAQPPVAKKVAGVAFKISRQFEGQQAAVLGQLHARYGELAAAEAERPGSSDAMLGEISDQLAGHEAFATGRAEATARIKASGDDSKDAAAREVAANKWMRSVVLPFAKYKRDEALRIKSNEMLKASLPFDEIELLEECREYLLRSLGVQGMTAAIAASTDVKTVNKQEKRAVPGEPLIFTMLA